MLLLAQFKNFSYLCDKVANLLGNRHKKRILKTMNITKIYTKLGEMQSAVTTKLEAVVERMRSDETKEAANKISAIALHSRLSMEQGAP